MPNFSLPDSVFESAASRFPTPFHLYDERSIRERARRLKKAFSWCPDFREYFAVKALPNPTVLRILGEEGCGLDCSSATELMLADRCGFRGDAVMFSANAMPPEEFDQARALGAYINLDDLSDIGILAAPIGDPQLLEIPLYTERFYAYVSEKDPAYGEKNLHADDLMKRPVWIMRNGLRLYDFSQREDKGRIPIYEEYFEGGRVGTLIQIVEDNGGLAILLETHVTLIPDGRQNRLRPIVTPVPQRTIVLVIRRDYIHEAMLNAVIRAIKAIIPGQMLENIVRADYIKL